VPTPLTPRTAERETSPDTGTPQPGGGGLNRWVFGTSALIILSALTVALVAPLAFNEVVSAINTVVVNSIGWYYVALVSGFVVFALVVAFSKLGTIRLGPSDEAPHYPWRTWFAMLFAAGMGIGLVFWGVAEPLWHLAAPPPGFGESGIEAQGRRAMAQTFLHWGVHAWAVYVVVGLAVAYAVHRKGRPVSIRWALEPILGKRTNGPIGDAIDIAAVVGTLFGVATSLGLGVNQIAAGLEHLGLVEGNTTVKLLIIAGITLLATLSVVSGLDRGIAFLSRANLWLAALLLMAVLILGPTLFVLRELVAGFGGYIQNFVSMSFQTFAFYGERGESWLGSWTTYYWGWWIAWSPFVGVFIARISRGRTVREFVAGVLLVPTAVTMVWFSVMGGTALYQQIFGGADHIVDGAVSTDTALFDMLGSLPGGSILSGLAIILVLVFFVTSSDSGSFVVDMLTHNGNPNPPIWSRVFWSVLEGSIAAVLIWASAASAGGDTSGISALQALTIVAAAPFSVVMIGMCFSVVKALRHDVAVWEHAEETLLRRELAEEAARIAGEPHP
jgi:choline/glycine/proline betaine transport protein